MMSSYEPERRATGLLVALALTAGWAGASACSRTSSPADETASIRLVDVFQPAMVSGGAAAPKREIPRTEWRFDAAASPTGPNAATRGWSAGPGVAQLAVRDGLLVGRTTADFPVVHIERTTGLDNHDLVHAVEVRMKVSAGGRVSVGAAASAKLDIQEQMNRAKAFAWPANAEIVPGEMRTYTLQSPMHTSGAEVRHLMLRPTDVPGAAFEIESVRVVFRKEHLATIPSGVAWQGLKEIYRESLASRAPETISFTVTLPDRPWLDLAVGTVEDVPVTFRVAAAPASGGAAGEPLLEHTVTTPHRWEPRPLDLQRFAGQTVKLTLSVGSGQNEALGFWGTPVIRNRIQAAASARTTKPRGVILIQADTLRRDHLDAYGYGRPTAPTLARLASEGVIFNNYVTQATWTKVSTPSMMTSLYPSSHGVTDFDHHLPASADTIAEQYRTAGYATISLASVLFTGQFTNLHQGFEELHEDGSFSTPGSSKTAREYVDRLTAWIEAHRDAPFFAFLHVFDPHDPYEPRQPYDTMWANPAHDDEHERQAREVKKIIKEPLRQAFGMPTREELVQAGFDAEAYVAHDRDWYDGSIRGMDLEVERVLQTLRNLGLEDSTLVVFLSDHGEEFLEHGRMFHGQSVYGELNRAPFIARWPAGLARGKVVDEVVQSIDVMPTLLELSGLPPPAGLQGQSLVPLVAAGGNGNGAGNGWKARPAVTEKALTKHAGGPPPLDTESYAIIDGRWKLVHHKTRPHGGPEFELFDFVKDPLDKANVADQHPDEVARLAKVLQGWKQSADAARLKPDSEASKNLSPEQLQRLRSLGYIR